MATKDTNTQEKTVAPEVLRPKETASSSEGSSAALEKKVASTGISRRIYRPSHRATFLGLSVVIAILAINVGAIMLLMNSNKTAKQNAIENGVTISPASLSKLGVSNTSSADSTTQLIVGPSAEFDKSVKVGGDVSVAGALNLNGKFTTTDASLNSLQGGDATFNKLSVNGDGVFSNVNLRQNLAVIGTTTLQGAVTASQLSVNRATVSGTLSVAGVLSANVAQANQVIAVGQLTIGGHVQTDGSAPGVRPGGSALGSNGTVSISGNDISGTVAANIGVGAGAGTLAYVSFSSAYSTMPHIVVTAVGGPVPGLYITRSTTGFTINDDSSLSAGGYAFDYMVMQ